VNPDNASWAFLFLVIVAVVVVVGIIVGMIVAGGLDRLQAPRPTATPEEPTAAGPPVEPTSDAVRARSQESVQEDNQP
jgi:hypothetical protein